MESFIDQMGRVLYEKILARDEYRVETFQMANAWKFLMECAEKNKKVKSCIMEIESKGNWYKISQLMLDDASMPVYANKECYVGRIIKARALDDDVVDFMKGEHRQTMKLPY